MSLHLPGTAAEKQTAAWRQAWRTPQALFNTLNAEFNFRVDAAADRANAKLPRFWDKEANGLAKPWEGERVWCNPPYNKIGPWVDKAQTADLAVLLVPCTFSTAWARRAMATTTEIRVFTERVAFEEPPELTAWREANGKRPSGPAGAPMLLIFRRGWKTLEAHPTARRVAFCDKLGRLVGV